jgi:putative addiction module CopG family antidote
MQVKLTKELAAFIAGKIETGDYADASDVVRQALRDLKSKEDPAEAESQELAELLLEAVRGPHRPLTARHFDQLRARARQSVAA